MTIKTELLKRHIFDYVKEHIEDFEIDADEIVNSTALEVLSEIQNIIQNDNYSDFERIERIVCLFEAYNLDAGVCHNF